MKGCVAQGSFLKFHMHLGDFLSKLVLFCRTCLPHKRRKKTRVFLNLGFGEPMFCTLDPRGFRHFRAFRDFRKSSNEPPKACLWLSELSSCVVIFVIPVVFVKSTELQNIGLANLF